MRVKFDFVTNSSTTSFVGWGITLEKSDILNNKKLLSKAFDQDSYKKPEISFEEWKDNIDNYELLDSALHGTILSHSYGGEYSDNYWIAGHPNDMKDDQTLGDYKKEIKEKLEELGFKVDKLEYIEEAWRDG